MHNAQKPRLVQCAYCLEAVPAAEATEDHVIARSWYPAETPMIAKWKVPACRSCNNRYSVTEHDTLGRLALCLDPTDKTFGPIAQKAIRSIDPKQAKSPRDIMHRFNRRETIRQGLRQIDNPKSQGVLPSFRDNFLAGSRTGIPVSAQGLKKVIEKWIRGIHLCEFREYVTAEQEVSIFLVEDHVAENAFAKILQYAKRIEKGPGVEVLIWRVDEDDRTVSLFAFKIWQQFRAYGSVEAGGAK